MIELSLAFRNTCFWDVDKEKIDKEKNKNFIISRVLEYGTIDDVRNLMKNYTKNEIAEIVEKSFNISKKTANFWGLILNIPKEKINVCSKLRGY